MIKVFSLKCSVVLAGLLALCIPSASAQTNLEQVPNQITNQFTPFYQEVWTWGTTINTNLSWTNEVSLSTGVATTTGQSVSDRVKLDYNWSSYHAGLEGDFIGAGSPIDKVEADAGWAFVNNHDFQFGPELGGGYDFKKTDSAGRQGAIVVDPKLFARKKLTQSWFVEVTYGQPVWTVGKFQPLGQIYTGAGGTF